MSLVVLLFITLAVLTADAGLLRRRVVVDVDGGVDDYQALVILINADIQKIIKIEAIICTKGNTDLVNVENNILRLLETCSRTDIPVYSGSYNQIMPAGSFQKYYGFDGFGDLKYAKKPNRALLKTEFATTALYNLLKKYPKQITLIVLGPQTNNAFGFRMYKKYADYLKDMFVMGGNLDGMKPEFNIVVDPEAAEIIFRTTKIPTTVLPFQACNNSVVTIGERLNVRGVSNPVWDFMDIAERKLFKVRPEYEDDYWVPCDTLAALAFLYPEKIVKVTSFHDISVKLDQPERGLFIYHKPVDRKPIKMIESVDWKLFMSGFVDAFANICYKRICVEQKVVP